MSSVEGVTDYREKESERKCVCVCVCEVNLWSGVTALPFLATDRAQLVQLAWLTSLFLQQCVFHPGPSSRLLRLSCLFNQSTRRRRKKGLLITHVKAVQES